MATETRGVDTKLPIAYGSNVYRYDDITLSQEHQWLRLRATEGTSLGTRGSHEPRCLSGTYIRKQDLLQLHDHFRP